MKTGIVYPEVKLILSPDSTFILASIRENERSLSYILQINSPSWKMGKGRKHHERIKMMLKKMLDEMLAGYSILILDPKEELLIV